MLILAQPLPSTESCLSLPIAKKKKSLVPCLPRSHPPLSHLLPELQPLCAQSHQAQTCLRTFVPAALAAQNTVPQDVLLAGLDVSAKMLFLYKASLAAHHSIPSPCHVLHTYFVNNISKSALKGRQSCYTRGTASHISCSNLGRLKTSK